MVRLVWSKRRAIYLFLCFQSLGVVYDFSDIEEGTITPAHQGTTRLDAKLMIELATR